MNDLGLRYDFIFFQASLRHRISHPNPPHKAIVNGTSPIPTRPIGPAAVPSKVAALIAKWDTPAPIPKVTLTLTLNLNPNPKS